MSVVIYYRKQVNEAVQLYIQGSFYSAGNVNSYSHRHNEYTRHNSPLCFILFYSFNFIFIHRQTDMYIYIYINTITAKLEKY